jgi:hypothetical protein
MVEMAIDNVHTDVYALRCQPFGYRLHHRKEQNTSSRIEKRNACLNIQSVRTIIFRGERQLTGDMITAATLLDVILTPRSGAGLRDIRNQRSTQSFSLFDCTRFFSDALIVFITSLAEVKGDVMRGTILIPTFVATKDYVLVIFIIVYLTRAAAWCETVAKIWQIG